MPAYELRLSGGERIWVAVDMGAGASLTEAYFYSTVYRTAAKDRSPVFKYIPVRLRRAAWLSARASPENGHLSRAIG